MSAISSLLTETESSPTPPLIDRKIVEEYCKENSVDVYELLNTFVKSGMDEFSDYLAKSGNKLDVPKGAKAVLHGSNRLFNQFKPQISRGGPNSNAHEALVYASDDPNFAIFLSILRGRDVNNPAEEEDDARSSVSYSSGEIRCSVNKAFVNSSCKLTDGYVYLLDQSFFVNDGQHHFTSPEPHVPMMIIPVKPEDLTTEIYIDMDK